MQIGIIGLGYVGPAAGRRLRRGRLRGRRPRRRPDQGRGAERAGAATSRTSPSDVAGAARRAPAGNRRLRRARRLRRGDPLRADAADSDSREPDLTYLVDVGRGARQGAALGPAGGARVDHLPGHHPRAPAADPRGLRPHRRQRLPPRLLAGADRPRPHRLHRAARRRSWSAASPRPATERARELYAEICDEVVVLSSPEAAELAKLLENIFRSVNIALVNELAQLCDRLGIDVWEVIDAASTKPFGFMRFDPGPGMGGHCLPVDPFYLAFKAREHDFYPEFIELAGKVNQAQPAFCVERIERALNDVGKPVNGSKILVLGVSYKGGVGDTRESPALKIVELPAGARRRGLLPRPLRPRAARAGPRLGRPRAGAARLPTWRRSSPPTPASTTRRWSPRRRWWSTSAASPAGSRRTTSSASSRSEPQWTF